VPNLHVTAFFRAKPGRSGELGTELLSLVAPTRREPGSLQYHILQGRDEPDIWFVREEWRGRADFDAHMATAYVKRLLAAVPDLCVDDPRIDFFETRSPQS
jgi:quinol monooxygenase YgiN